MSIAEPRLADLAVFYGKLTESLARIYVRAARPSEAGVWSLGGSIVGPHCSRSTTLKTTASFRDLGEGATLLAEAVLTDPCCWSPALPNRYLVSAKLLCDGKPRFEVTLPFGIRALIAERRSLYFSAKRCVLRGVRWDREQVGDPQSWIDQAAAVVTEADDALCRRATETGLRVIADLTRSADAQLESEIQRLGRWPAVAVAMLGDRKRDARRASQLAPNLLLAMRTADPQSPVPDWADLLAVDWPQDADRDEFGRRLATADAPLLLLDRPAKFSSLADARRGCDRLQREMAAFGQFAGYIV